MKQNRKSRGRRQINRYSSSEIRRLYALEDKWFESLFDGEHFRSAVRDLRNKLLKRSDEVPDLLKQPDHHCTVHRYDQNYADWDKPIDDLCNQFDIDKGFDLAYGPRYKIERHVLFKEQIGNLFHPLIRCETDLSPVPHISKICILPPSQPLSNDELNWLLADLELLIVERQPVYPISPSASDELFNGLRSKDINHYRQRLKEAIDKRIITDPTIDAQTLIALIEILKDEHNLLFKQIASLLDMSYGAIYKRYRRATLLPTSPSMWISPIPRKKGK